MSSAPRSKAARPLQLALALFVVYLGNVFAGKISVLMGMSTIFGIGDVAEFLTLFGSAACFIVAVLIKEREANASSSDNA